MLLEVGHYLGIAFTFSIVAFLSFSAMKQVKQSDDFLLGKKGMGPAGVVGILLGTILGGASTIGSAQMAFSEGITGFLFTFGAATGLIGMSLFLPRLEKIHRVNTIPQVLCRRYGKKARPITGIISIFGIFFSIVASNLSMSDLVAVVANTTIPYAYFILFVLVMIYVLFGGMLGASWVGIFKTIMLYLLLIISGMITLPALFGEQGGFSLLPATMTQNIFPKGWPLGIASYCSAIIGVASTQTYLQAYYPAKDFPSAQRGYWISALLILPVGVLSVAIGLFMRVNHPEILASQAMPYFLFNYLPSWVCGTGAAVLILGGLGTAAGLIMGMTTIVLKDLIEIWKPNLGEKQLLWVGRIFIMFIGTLSILFSFWQYGSQILIWNYLSMGLRGAGVFLPLLAAFALPRKFDSKIVVLSMGISTLVMLYVQFFTSNGIVSLWYGMGASFICLVVAYWKRKGKRK